MTNFISIKFLCEKFLLTHPVWDVTLSNPHAYVFSDISTHTSRVGCDTVGVHFNTFSFISTHTSRVGCDDRGNIYRNEVYISTHTSRVGCDPCLNFFVYFFLISTHTSRVGCDPVEELLVRPSADFYSHIPCGM